MTSKKLILVSVFFYIFSLPCFAEGQSGMGAFFAIIFILSFVFYTVAFGLIIRLVSIVVNPRKILSIKKSFGIALVLSILVMLIGGFEVSPFFWFN